MRRFRSVLLLVSLFATTGTAFAGALCDLIPACCSTEFCPLHSKHAAQSGSHDSHSAQNCQQHCSMSGTGQQAGSDVVPVSASRAVMPDFEPLPAPTHQRVSVVATMVFGPPGFAFVPEQPPRS